MQSVLSTPRAMTLSAYHPLNTCSKYTGEQLFMRGLPTAKRAYTMLRHVVKMRPALFSLYRGAYQLADSVPRTRSCALAYWPPRPHSQHYMPIQSTDL